MSHSDAMLATWDATKQAQWRTRNPEKALAFHLLLDASPSMHAYGEELIKAYNMYLAWVQAHAGTMSTLTVDTFSEKLIHLYAGPLPLAKPLTKATYTPLDGNGTALYYAIGTVCNTVETPGQHILVLFTDGLDNRSEEIGWSRGSVFSLVTTLQQHGWLCVFLGAFKDALQEGLSMGFTQGNCLEFATDRIPEAFQRLLQATTKYLQASQDERKLLAASGVF